MTPYMVGHVKLNGVFQNVRVDESDGDMYLVTHVARWLISMSLLQCWVSYLAYKYSQPFITSTASSLQTLKHTQSLSIRRSSSRVTTGSFELGLSHVRFTYQTWLVSCFPSAELQYMCHSSFLHLSATEISTVLAGNRRRRHDRSLPEFEFLNELNPD